MVMVPSYDDLTPGIPDVSETRLDEQLALFLRDDLKRTQDPSKTTSAPSIASFPSTPSNERQATALYACLRRQTANGELQTTDCEPQTANCTLLEIARDFSPRIMRVSASEVLLDVSGLGRLIGEPPAIAKELARALAAAAIEARVAIAPTQTVARLLAMARFPNSQISTFSNLPVSLLQPLETLPPAMNHRDRARPYDTRDAQRLYETLAKWGIATLGALAALPIAELSSRLGRRGVALHRLARGLDPKPFVSDADTPRFIGRLELEWPIEALEPLSFVFARLLEPLSLSLERADRGAAAIRLELRLTDRSTHARVLQLPAPMRDARVLRTLLLLDLEADPPAAAVDIVTIELDPAPARITQFSLLQRALPSPETLSTLTARLAALLGESRIGSPTLIDTHEPGAFQMQPFKPESPVRLDAPVGPTFRSGVSEVSATLRRQRHPPAIRVSVEHGRPVYLAASRRGMPQGAVVQAAGPWRASGGWWVSDAGRAQGADACRAGDAHACRGGKADAGRAAPVAPPVPPKPGFTFAGEGGKPRRGEGGWNRDEWDVALSSGVVCRIYQDRTTERWFLDGTYD